MGDRGSVTHGVQSESARAGMTGFPCTGQEAFKGFVGSGGYETNSIRPDRKG